VENRLRDALHHDRARVQTGKISRFGLLEMSRQRLQPSLGETSYTPCPRCHGTGHIRGTESSALHILRILQEEAMKENTGAVHVQLPVDVATFLLNEKRVDIHTVESRLKVNVVLIPNIHMETPHYTITRLRHDELNLTGAAEPSYKMAIVPETESVYQTAQAAAPARQEAAVKSIAPPQRIPAAPPVVPPAAPQAQGGLFERIFGWFKKRGEEAPAAEAMPAAEPVAAITRSERPSERRERERKPGQRRGRGEGRGEARQQEPRPADAREGREARGSEQPKQPRPPRQPKPRPEAEAAPRVTEAAEAPREAAGEEKREPRSRRGRGNRRPREARPEAAATAGVATPHAIIETAGYRAIIEIARPAKAVPAAAAAPAQQALELQAPAAAPAPLPGAVTASPATILADLAASRADLLQVETQGAAAAAAESSEPSRPRRRRRPTVKAEVEPVSLMQVETTAPVTSIAESPAPATPHPTRRRQRPQVTPPQEPLVQVETRGE
jgi:ribonuclease E